MAGLNVTALNAMLNADNTVWPPNQFSLHNADPGAATTVTSGTELSGNGPSGPYARGTATWSTATGKQLNATNLPTFQCPGGSSVAYLGYWRGSTYLGSRAFTTTETFNGPGTYTPVSVYEALS